MKGKLQVSKGRLCRLELMLKWNSEYWTRSEVDGIESKKIAGEAWLRPCVYFLLPLWRTFVRRVKLLLLLLLQRLRVKTRDGVTVTKRGREQISRASSSPTTEKTRRPPSERRVSSSSSPPPPSPPPHHPLH
ncbi:hypothetical protein S245_041040, partial [Arachis hypogaea]